MLGHDNIKNYYRTNFALMHFHKYSLSELDNMMPWEKAVYLDMLAEHIRQQQEAQRDRAAIKKSKR